MHSGHNAEHALGALYKAAADGLPTLADPGYEGTGIGIHTPVKRPTDGRRLDIDNRTYNAPAALATRGRRTRLRPAAVRRRGTFVAPQELGVA